MQRLQGWVRYAAEITGRTGLGSGAGTQEQPQQQQDSDEEDFIYARIGVHSDDEDAAPHTKPPRPRRPRTSAPDVTAPSSPLAGQQHSVQQQGQSLPTVQLSHQHCHSDSELNQLDPTSRHQRLSGHADLVNQGNSSSLIRLDSTEAAGWEPDWGGPAGGAQQQQPQSLQQQHSATQHEPLNVAAARTSSGNRPAACDGRCSNAEAAAAAALAELEPTAGFDADGPATSSGLSRSSSSGVQADDYEYNEEIPDHDHSQKRQELLIYAIPLVRGKVIFLPVCPWRSEPEQQKGWRKAVAGHVGKVQTEATDIWQKMAEAEQGTIANRVYKLGKRVLDNISPEERLMRGVPKNISKVIIHHPSQVSPDTIMEQMQTMTKSYGIKAVGRAAAATVMLPIAVGVDLIILPGPQVLTYYTMWELYRNTNGALGTTRMTKFITQGGSSENIRVNYTVEPRLDKYYDQANDCPEGVLSEDDIDGLVTDLREPDLAEALMSLRNKALREAGKRTSRGGDEYVSLPPTDLAAAPQAFGNNSSS